MDDSFSIDDRHQPEEYWERINLDVTGKSIEHILFLRLLATYDIRSPKIQANILQALDHKDAYGRKLEKGRLDVFEEEKDSK